MRHRVSVLARCRKLAALGPLCALAASAAANPRPEAPQERVPPEVQSLVDAALSLPVEYQSDILIGLAEKGKLQHGRLGAQSLEDIFNHAGEAKMSYPKIEGVPTGDTLSARQAAAFELGLDTLSIQCRVVRVMLDRSAAKARELFARIEHPSPPQADCEQPLISSVRIYYDTLGALFDRAYTQPERQHGDDTQLLMQAIGEIRSIEELVPAADMLVRLKVRPTDWGGLVGLFTGALASVEGSDRTFSYAEGRLVLSKAVQGLLEREAGYHLSAGGLVQAYRKFLVRQLSGPRCADSLTLKGNDSRRFFNEVLLPFYADRSLVIPPEAARPSRVLGSARVLQLQLPSLSAVIHELDLLKNSPDGQMHEHGAWEETVSATLRGLEDSSDGPDTCPECIFHQKAMAYLVLVDLVPAGPMQDALANSYLNFLAADRMQWSDPMEWLEHLKYLLRLTAKLTQQDRDRIADLHRRGKVLNMLPGEHAAELLAKMRNSRNTLISTYALEETLFPSPYQVPALPK